MAAAWLQDAIEDKGGPDADRTARALNEAVAKRRDKDAKALQRLGLD